MPILLITRKHIKLVYKLEYYINTSYKLKITSQ